MLVCYCCVASVMACAATPTARPCVPRVRAIRNASSNTPFHECVAKEMGWSPFEVDIAA